MARRIDTDLDYDVATGTFRFRIGLELKNVNVSMWGGGWRGKYHQGQVWEGALRAAIARFNNRADVFALTSTPDRAPRQRMRVTVVRFVRSKSGFIRDYENRVMSTKVLYDALKRVGLIYDDSEQWVERVGPEQAVSPDRQFWTEIRIEPCGAETRLAL